VVAVPRLCKLYRGICLTTEEKIREESIHDSKLTLRVEDDDEEWISVWILFDEISVNKYVALLFAGLPLCFSEKFEPLVE
jgi:hypothetical protein